MLPAWQRAAVVPTLLLCCILLAAGWATPDGDRATPGSALGSAASGSAATSPNRSPVSLPPRSQDDQSMGGSSLIRSTDGSPAPLRSRSSDDDPLPRSSSSVRSADRPPIRLRSRSVDDEDSDGPAAGFTPATSPPPPPVDDIPRGDPPAEPSACKVTGSQADCSGRRLTLVPQRLPATVTSLDLSQNALAELGDGAFARYPLLRRLRLQFNAIASLHRGAFRGCGLLEELDLFNNSLPAVPDAQLAPLLGSLLLLNVSNNLYGRAELGATFGRLSSLRHLWLGGELVSEVRAADLAALRSLDLATFSLKTGRGFAAYEPGALASLAGSADPSVTLDCDLDAAPETVTPMLADLAATAVGSLRFRRLFAAGYYAGAADLFEPLPRLARLRSLSFFRGKLNENLLYLVLKHLQRAGGVRSLSLLSVDFAFSSVAEVPRAPVGPLPLGELVFRDISNPDVLLYAGGFAWYGGLDALVISNVNFNVVPCAAWAAMRRVVDVDVSGNRLTDAALFNAGCDYRGTLPRLRSLALGDNALTRLAAVAALAAEWPALREVRLPRNRVGGVAETCEWRQPVELLDLSYNRAAGEVFGCLPLTLRHLDLSHSDVDRLDVAYFAAADRLETLLLSGNSIKFIPPGWRAPSLGLLAVDRNSFGTIDRGTFELMPALRRLRADGNPFQCTCDLWAFLEEARADASPVRLEGWPDNYTCYHPAALLGTQLERFRPGALECDARLVALVSALATAALVGAGLALCRRFDAPWYLRALWNLLRSRRRRRSREGGVPGRGFHFHAFVSYSHADAAWVRELLMPQLETARPALRVCVHERDFTPGLWIIDNIIESIERSRRVIFVLSSSFVDSEWCNYELYFAHQRPAREAIDDLVLLLKEPIRAESLPSRFCKLRKLLSRKTYLEWPAEAAKQGFFWAQLRALLRCDDGVTPDDAGTDGVKGEEVADGGRSV